MDKEIQTETKTTKCLNCGTEFQGNFCPECGQSAETGPFTMRFIYENLLSAFISKDGGIWFTLKNLFIRPGEMIVEILKGKRRRYFSPFPMLFFTLTVYILLFTITGSRGDIKALEKEYMNREKTVDTTLNDKTKEAIATVNEVNRLFGKGIMLYNSHYTAVTMLTLPIFLFATRMWYGKNNRKRYFRAEYLVAITYSMVMVVLYRCLTSLVFLLSKNVSDTMGDFIPFVMIAAFTVCFRKMLGFSVAKTAWRSLLAVVLYYIILGIAILAISLMVVIFIYLPFYRQKHGI